MLLIEALLLQPRSAAFQTARLGLSLELSMSVNKIKHKVGNRHV